MNRKKYFEIIWILTMERVQFCTREVEQVQVSSERAFFERADSIGMPAYRTVFGVYEKFWMRRESKIYVLELCVWGVSDAMYTVNILWGVVNRVKIRWETKWLFRISLDIDDGAVGAGGKFFEVPASELTGVHCWDGWGWVWTWYNLNRSCAIISN